MDLQLVKTKMTIGPKKGQYQYTLKRVSYGNITSEAILDEIQSASTFSRADTDAIIHAFADVMIEGIADGRIVDLGVLGTIYPKITAKAVDSKEECTPETIKSKGILYRPDMELDSDAKKMKFRIIDVLPSDAAPGTGDDGDDTGGDDNGGGTTPGGNTGNDDGGFAG